MRFFNATRVLAVGALAVALVTIEQGRAAAQHISAGHPVPTGQYAVPRPTPAPAPAPAPVQTPITAPEPTPQPAPPPAPAPAPAPLPIEAQYPGAYILYPGESIQSAVNRSPAGTTFVLKAGVYARQSVRPKDGMKFIGEAGAVLDGQKAVPRAFDGENVNNVTVRGLRITNYAPPETAAALEAINTTGWVVENNEVDNNT